MLARTLLLGVRVTTASPRWSSDVEQARAMYRGAEQGLGRRALAAALAFTAVWSNEPVADLRSLAWEALGEDDAYEESLAAGWQLTWSCPALALGGEWELAERRLTQALAPGGARLATRRTQRAVWARKAVRALRGNLSGAESDGRQVLELHGDPTWRPAMVVMFAFLLIEVLIDRSSPAAAQALLEELDFDGGDIAPLAVGAEVLWARSRLRLAQGRPADAFADIEAAREVLGRAGLDPVALFSAEESAAGALAALGRHEQALAAARDALRRARIHGAPAAIGTALPSRRCSSAVPSRSDSSQRPWGSWRLRAGRSSTAAR